MNVLKWENLLNQERRRSSNNPSTVKGRNAFEADYDRIVGSSSVRRLQDKAQVYPLQANDFVRTRLTHSIEVSGIARSLGKQVADKLLEERKIKKENVDEIAAILQTVGLIHDIGNPPFGHFGESVIRKWFEKYFIDQPEIVKQLTKNQKNDFLYFDGNVQNLRVVTKLQMLNDLHGANFTYATLAVLMKYPWSSNEIEQREKSKFGYFQSEESIVEDIRNHTGLAENIRHPLTYLLEAADDITYIGDDIEDGVKKKLINWSLAYKDFCSNFDKNQEIKTDIIEKISKICQKRPKDIPEVELADSRNFRNILQSFMIGKAGTSFIKHYDEIMRGEMIEKDLFEGDNNISEVISWYKELMKNNCYSCDEILDLELAAQKVIGTMLDNYMRLIWAGKDELEDIASYNNRLLKSISENYVYTALHENAKENKIPEFNELPLYNKIHLCVDYIVGMTDSYAVRQYKKIMGISLSLKG